MAFQQDAILKEMEKRKRPSGAFVAAPQDDYQAMWIRDHLYCSYAYWYLGEHDKLREGVWLIFDLFKRYAPKLRARIASPAEIARGVLHAKYDADTFDEITDDWGHHQLDVLGLFLHIVADLDFKHMRIIRDADDLEILQLLVFYLRSVEYWQRPDNGMWEEHRLRHASSIGAVVAGLGYIERRELAIVPAPLVQFGRDALRDILPYESRDACNFIQHRHDCDAAQLSLLWPFNIIVKPEDADLLLSRITGGHETHMGETHSLVQRNGLNRYYGDEYLGRQTDGVYRGISAEWPIFFFWISIIHSQRHDFAEALRWFKKGTAQITDNMIPEAYRNGKPDVHTPLAWAHALALIAYAKLPDEFRQKVE